MQKAASIVIDSRHDENPSAKPVYDGAEIDEAASHRNIGQVHRPDLVGSGDRQLAQEVGIDFVTRRWFRGIRAAIDRLDALFFISVATCSRPVSALLSQALATSDFRQRGSRDAVRRSGASGKVASGTGRGR